MPLLAIITALLPGLAAPALQESSDEALAPFSPRSWLVLEEERPLYETLFHAEPPSSNSEGWRSLEEARLPAGTRLAYCRFDVDGAHVRMARLTGAETLFVNGEPFWGDPEERGWRGVPVALRAGVNHLFVKGVRAETELELWVPETRLVVGTWDAQSPKLSSRPSSWWDFVHFPIFNASTEIAHGLHVHYGRAAPESWGAGGASEWADGGSIPPLAMFPANVTFMVDYEEYAPGDPNEEVDDEAAVIRLEVYVRKAATADTPVLRIPIGVERRPTRRPLNPILQTLVRPAPIRQLSSDDMEPGTLFVHGTGGTPEEDAALLAAARYDQARLAYRTNCTPMLVSDLDYLPKLAGQEGLHWLGKYQLLVLYGNHQTNGAIDSVVGRDVETRFVAGGVRCGEDFFSGDHLHGYAVLPNRVGEAPSAAVMGSTGLEGVRRSFLRDLYAERVVSWVRVYDGDELVAER